MKNYAPISRGRLTKKEMMKFAGLNEDEFEEGMRGLVDKGLLKYYILNGYYHYILYPLEAGVYDEKNK